MPRGPNSAPTALTRAVAEILRGAFEDLLITQATFGQQVGMSSSVVSLTFLGDRVPDLAQFIRLCEAVGLPPVYVLSAAQVKVAAPTS